MPYIPDTHPVPSDPDGTVRIRLDALIEIREAGRKMRVPAQDLFCELANAQSPGLFGEPEIATFAPGYTMEDYGRARVIWPVRDQETFDPVVRFVPGDAEARLVFELISARLASGGVLA